MKALRSLIKLSGLEVIFLIAFFYPGKAQTIEKSIREETVLYRPVPDILIDTGEASIQLSALWSAKPILLTFVFARCVDVCTPYLEILDNALYKAGGFGQDYQVVILSFDSTDYHENMRLLRQMAALSGNRRYICATTDSAGLAQITKATGFWYQKIDSTNQFAHPTMVVGISNGHIRRVLTGGDVSAARLNEVIAELTGYYVRSYPLPSDNVRFRCFQFDPVTGEIKPDWGLLILGLPGLLAILSLMVIFYRARRESRIAERRRRPLPTSEHQLEID